MRHVGVNNMAEIQRELQAELLTKFTRYSVATNGDQLMSECCVSYRTCTGPPPTAQSAVAVTRSCPQIFAVLNT